MPADKREPGGRRFDPSTVGTVLVIPHEATSLEGSGRALAAGAEPLREAFSPASAEAVRLPRPWPFRPTELAKAKPAKPAKPQAALGTDAPSCRLGQKPEMVGSQGASRRESATAAGEHRILVRDWGGGRFRGMPLRHVSGTINPLSCYDTLVKAPRRQQRLSR